MNLRRSKNSREKKKSKKSMKPPEPKLGPPKNKIITPAKIKFKSLTFKLGNIVDALEKRGRLGVKEVVVDEKGKKYLIDKKYGPTAIYIQKTDLDHEPHPGYDIFLKFPGQGKKNWFYFSLDTLNKDPNNRESYQIILRERNMVWNESKNGFEERNVWSFYYNIREGTGKKELAKMRKSAKKRSRNLLFGKVINAARIILDNCSYGPALPLIYQEYPKGIERKYPDAKAALWFIEKSLKRHEVKEIRGRSLETHVA